MLGGAGVMPSYEYEHIPAIDCLGKECQTELPPKQVGSVAAQMGKKQILTETFAGGALPSYISFVDTLPKIGNLGNSYANRCFRRYYTAKGFYG
jgi:hypothetical protein